jgi:hypothetical protein
VRLRLGAQYLPGTEAGCLAERELADENGNGRLGADEPDVRRSRTTFLQPQFGVTLRLGGTDWQPGGLWQKVGGRHVPDEL